jgi:hypothetical protein
MIIDIRDNIPDELALSLVHKVVKGGRVSKGEKGKLYYCWMTIFKRKGIEYVVHTRQYRKQDCFVVYKKKV